jgi:small subunit ribosomal protein S15
MQTILQTSKISKLFTTKLSQCNVICFSEFHWITRKDSLRKLTDKHCVDVKQQKIDAYRASLEAQQVDFLREKAQKLQWIRNEEKECGVEPTVSEADIEQVVKQLKELELSKKEMLKDKTQ